MPVPFQLFIATRKGLWIATSNADRSAWSLSAPHFLGKQCHHAVRDPRDGVTLLCANRQWHLGPTVHRSLDGGLTWKEAATPPRFTTGEARGRAVDHVFWLSPGHASEPGVWYAGTSPQGLFRSEDGGVTWVSVAGFNDHPDQHRWVGSDKDQTPDGGKLHSILVDPRDPAHLYVSMSGGGTFESTDRGETWAPLNAGVSLDMYPPKEDGSEYPYGHDPHCVVLHPKNPDRLWQQNHCGIHRLDRGEGRWLRVGRAMPEEVGDIGFGIVVHPEDPDRAWVFPMDGGGDWPRTSPSGRPAVYTTADGGASWQRQDAGLPTEQAWWTVKRQALVGDLGAPMGLYLGLTSGEVWASVNEGASFAPLFRHLPQIHALSVAGA